MTDAWAPPTGGGVMAALAQAAPDKSLLDYIAEGREIGFVIILLSFVAVGLIIAQLVQVRMAKLAPPEAVERLHDALRRQDIRRAIEVCRDPGQESFLTRTMLGGLERCIRSPFGFLELRTALQESGERQVAKLQRVTDGVALIAAVAPMLGLLGTVVGMVGAFDTLGMSQGPVRPDLLAGNISEALITTVLGLLVAIPCTAATTYLRNRIEHLTGEVGGVVEELAAYLESAGPAARPPQPGTNAQARQAAAAPRAPQPAPEAAGAGGVGGAGGAGGAEGGGGGAAGGGA